jgi:cyclophilin family peptidyl-prolyl cis-trans isomerase
MIKALMASLSLVTLQAFAFAPAEAQQATDPIVIMQTTRGPIALQIYANGAPLTSNNFLDLVQKGFYNGLSFHRVETWCIQGGDPQGNGTGSYIDPETHQPRYLTIEINKRLRHNMPGVLAMARSNDPNSASCQFYITKQAMPQLDGNYAIFGRVVRGMRSVDMIRVGDRIISAEIQQPQTSAQPPQPVGTGKPESSGF